MGGSPPVPSASLRTLTHIEFDKDSSSEMEFDEDRDETPRLIEDAEDFEGNDTNVHFIVRPFNVAAEKADEILNNTLARMKRQDKGPLLSLR